MFFNDTIETLEDGYETYNDIKHHQYLDALIHGGETIMHIADII